MGFKHALFLIILCHGVVFADPWGKDADLVCPSCQTEGKKGFSGPFKQAVYQVILFHQKVLSEADGPRSHFRPTSSQYMLDAIEEYGILYGFPKGCDRLMRENGEEWVYPICTLKDGTVIKLDPLVKKRT